MENREEKLKEIKDKAVGENRKAIKKFVLIMIGCFLVGMLSGYVSQGAKMNSLADVLRRGGNLLLQNVYYLMIIVVFAALAGVVLLFSKAKKLHGTWDEEDDIVLGKIEKYLDCAMIISNTTMILIVFFFAVIMQYGSAKGNKMSMLGITIFLFAGVIACLFATQKIVDFTKYINPEKNGSVYDTNFQKKWMDSCDEAEREKIYKASWFAYKITNYSCVILMVILMTLNEIFHFGIMPSFCVAVIWLIQTLSYSFEEMRLNK